jgi:hypothetical protein
MKPYATVAIHQSVSSEVQVLIKERLTASYSHVNFTFEEGTDTLRPIAVRFDFNDADLGSIDGDKNAPSIAMITGIQNEANRAFREATSRK